MKRRILLMVMLGLAGMSGRGQVMFQKTYGGLDAIEEGASVQQTHDGGYIIAGTTSSYGAGSDDLYLIKTNSSGSVLWTKTFGESGGDAGYYVQQTADSGYIVAGNTNNFGAGGVYLIKTKSNGDTLWTKTYGGLNSDAANCVQQTNDGGYIILGYTYSYGAGNNDVYLIKINSIGDTLWTRTYGGTVSDVGTSVQQTTDGGYIIIGYTDSYGSGNSDVYLIKTNSTGDTLWTKTYGGIGYECGNYVRQTTDGGFIIVGFTGSFGAGNNDVYLIKTNFIGDTLWTKAYGGTGYEKGSCVQQTSDGGYIISGETNSFGVSLVALYLIKTDSIGNILWTKIYGGTHGSSGLSVQQTSDGGYIVVGSIAKFSMVSGSIYLIKTDSNGNTGCFQGNSSTIISSTATQVTLTSTIISRGGIVLSPHTIVNNGCFDTTLCTNAAIYEIPQTTSLLLTPNPFSAQATLTFQSVSPYNNMSLHVYNLFGQEVQNIFVGNNKDVIIHRNNLPSGMYFYKLIDETKALLGTGKMVVE